MGNIFYCEYRTDGSGFFEARSTGSVVVLQIFSTGGTISIGGRAYPITYGGLYFIGKDREYAVNPAGRDAYSQNTAMVSWHVLDDLAKILDFEELLRELFQRDEGYHLPLAHYKIVDARFKEMFGIYRAGNPYSKALFVSKILDIFNYVAATNLKRK